MCRTDGVTERARARPRRLLAPPHDRFRVDYADPNTDFHRGWHRDDDHPELGPTHFQLRTAAMADPRHEPARFEVEAPARILWACLDRLFGDVLPAQNG